MRIVAISGSPRPAGNTNYLVDQALAEAAKLGVQTEKIILSQYRVDPCQGHPDCRLLPACALEDDAPWILEKFRQADGVILATPVYWFNMSAQMKAFIDRNYFPYMHKFRLVAKIAGLIVVGGSRGLETTERALRRFLNYYISDDCIVTATGLARRPGEIEGKMPAIEGARDLGRHMALDLVQANA